MNRPQEVDLFFSHFHQDINIIEPTIKGWFEFSCDCLEPQEIPIVLDFVERLMATSPSKSILEEFYYTTRASCLPPNADYISFFREMTAVLRARRPTT